MNQYYQDNMLFGMNPSSYLHRYAVNSKVSGNLACISEIKNAAVVLYSPRGCGFHYRCHVRSGQSPVYELECADLRNNDVIFGGEKKLTALLQKGNQPMQPLSQLSGKVDPAISAANARIKDTNRARILRNHAWAHSKKGAHRV